MSVHQSAPQPPDPNQNIEQQIHDIFHLMRTRVARGAEITLTHVTIAERNALALISKQVSEAIAPIENTLQRQYDHGNGLDQYGVEDLLKEIKALKQTPPTPNGDSLNCACGRTFEHAHLIDQHVANTKQPGGHFVIWNGDEQGGLERPSDEK